MRTRLAAMTLGLLVGTAPYLLAHHSFSAEYDANQPVKVSGTVTRVDWQNPHIWFFVDVKERSGKVTNWGFSGGPPGVLQRRGISRTALKTGDVVVVEGFRARTDRQRVRRQVSISLTDEACSPPRMKTGLRVREDRHVEDTDERIRARHRDRTAAGRDRQRSIETGGGSDSATCGWQT